MTTREQAIEALQTKLTGAYGFSVVTRRLVSPETMASPGNPALALVVHHETYATKPPLPRKLTMTVMAIIYIDAGAPSTGGIPDAVLNPIKDAIDAALAPDNRMTGFCTLGGLVQSCVINGEVVQAPGDKTGKGLAVVPIDIVFP